MNPKLIAKKQALMGMSKKLKEDTRNPLKPDLAAKSKMKIVIDAEDGESAMDGLSKAQELIQAKFGALGLDEATMEGLEDEEEYEDCEACSNMGCPMCYEESPEMEDEAEEIVE